MTYTSENQWVCDLERMGIQVTGRGGRVLVNNILFRLTDMGGKPVVQRQWSQRYDQCYYLDDYDCATFHAWLSNQIGREALEYEHRAFVLPKHAERVAAWYVDRAAEIFREKCR